MTIEVKEITLPESGLYSHSSYPVPGIYLVDVNGSYKTLMLAANNFVSFITNHQEFIDDIIAKSKNTAAPSAPGVSEDFAIRIMETAIRETKKP